MAFDIIAFPNLLTLHLCQNMAHFSPNIELESISKEAGRFTLIITLNLGDGMGKAQIRMRFFTATKNEYEKLPDFDERGCGYAIYLRAVSHALGHKVSFRAVIEEGLYTGTYTDDDGEPNYINVKIENP